jgi:hypothetical protein
MERRSDDLLHDQYAATAVAGVAVRSLPPAVVGHFDVQMARFGP